MGPSHDLKTYVT